MLRWSGHMEPRLNANAEEDDHEERFHEKRVSENVLKKAGLRSGEIRLLL